MTIFALLEKAILTGLRAVRCYDLYLYGAVKFGW